MSAFEGIVKWNGEAKGWDSPGSKYILHALSMRKEAGGLNSARSWFNAWWGESAELRLGAERTNRPRRRGLGVCGSGRNGGFFCEICCI